LKPERWGSPLVQEKYRGEKACDKRHPYRRIIIIIIIITVLVIKQLPAFRNLNTGSFFYRRTEHASFTAQEASIRRPTGISRDTLSAEDSKKRTAVYLNVRLD
jgi:uncharacterized protein YxeA